MVIRGRYTPSALSVSYTHLWKLLWLFLIYSFAGWVLETVLASLKQKKFANRGIINGPFCLIYGFGGFFITAFTRELTGIWLFLGCAIVALSLIHI